MQTTLTTEVPVSGVGWSRSMVGRLGGLCWRAEAAPAPAPARRADADATLAVTLSVAVPGLAGQPGPSVHAGAGAGVRTWGPAGARLAAAP